MLTASQYDALIGPLMELYESYEQSVINDLARRLSKAPMTSSAAWSAQRLSESGMVFEQILERLAPLVGRSESELRRAFTRAGVKAMRFDDSVYKKAGLNPLPLNLSPAMAAVLAENISRTNATMRNLCLSTASSGQDAFVQASDLAFMQVSSGAMSYQQAVRAAVKDVAAQGLSVVAFSGRRDSLDVATRRNVLTGVGQLANQLSLARAGEMGVDLVQVSAHAGARTGKGVANHLAWQGKVYSRSGTDPRYPGLVKVTGYGTGAGLGGYNCRHSLFPFFPGISENAYEEATLDEFAGRKVTYNKQEMDFYAATQEQRGIERKLRYWRRQKAAMEAAGLDSTPETDAVLHYRQVMTDFIKQTGLVRQRSREQIIGV
jgi:hypothetical protein